MHPTSDPDGPAPGPGRTGAGLLVAGPALLVAAGLVLWWLRGEAVFTDTVLAALTWCF